MALASDEEYARRLYAELNGDLFRTRRSTKLTTSQGQSTSAEVRASTVVASVKPEPAKAAESNQPSHIPKRLTGIHRELQRLLIDAPVRSSNSTGSANSRPKHRDILLGGGRNAGSVNSSPTKSAATIGMEGSDRCMPPLSSNDPSRPAPPGAIPQQNNSILGRAAPCKQEPAIADVEMAKANTAMEVAGAGDCVVSASSSGSAQPAQPKSAATCKTEAAQEESVVDVHSPQLEQEQTKQQDSGLSDSKPQSVLLHQGSSSPAAVASIADMDKKHRRTAGADQSSPAGAGAHGTAGVDDVQVGHKATASAAEPKQQDAQPARQTSHRSAASKHSSSRSVALRPGTGDAIVKAEVAGVIKQDGQMDALATTTAAVSQSVVASVDVSEPVQASARVAAGKEGARRGRKIPKLPMVRYNKKWYRARVIQEVYPRVLLEFAGLEPQSGSFWLDMDSDRIWTGSYRGKDWRYLGDGGWEPKSARSRRNADKRNNTRNQSTQDLNQTLNVGELVESESDKAVDLKEEVVDQHDDGAPDTAQHGNDQSVGREAVSHISKVQAGGGMVDLNCRPVEQGSSGRADLTTGVAASNTWHPQAPTPTNSSQEHAATWHQPTGEDSHSEDGAVDMAVSHKLPQIVTNEINLHGGCSADLSLVGVTPKAMCASNQSDAMHSWVSSAQDGAAAVCSNGAQVRAASAPQLVLDLAHASSVAQSNEEEKEGSCIPMESPKDSGMVHRGKRKGKPMRSRMDDTAEPIRAQADCAGGDHVVEPYTASNQAANSTPAIRPHSPTSSAVEHNHASVVHAANTLLPSTLVSMPSVSHSISNTPHASASCEPAQQPTIVSSGSNLVSMNRGRDAQLAVHDASDGMEDCAEGAAVLATLRLNAPSVRISSAEATAGEAAKRRRRGNGWTKIMRNPHKPAHHPSNARLAPSSSVHGHQGWQSTPDVAAHAAHAASQGGDQQHRFMSTDTKRMSANGSLASSSVASRSAPQAALDKEGHTNGHGSAHGVHQLRIGAQRQHAHAAAHPSHSHGSGDSHKRARGDTDSHSLPPTPRSSQPPTPKSPKSPRTSVASHGTAARSMAVKRVHSDAATALDAAAAAAELGRSLFPANLPPLKKPALMQDASSGILDCFKVSTSSTSSMQALVCRQDPLASLMAFLPKPPVPLFK